MDCSGATYRLRCGRFVIEQDRRDFPSVELRLVNAIDDNLQKEKWFSFVGPSASSDPQVSKILPKLSRYKYAVITEHLPGFAGFFLP